MVFVNSMSDLFHKEIPRTFISKIFDTMERAHWHTFQVLTKRYLSDGQIPSRTLFVHSRSDTYVVWCLCRRRRSPFAIAASPRGSCWRSVSIYRTSDRSIGKIELDGIDWVIVGGESGPHARPMNADWVRDIRDQCAAAGVAFFSNNGEDSDQNLVDGYWRAANGINFLAISKHSARAGETLFGRGGVNGSGCAVEL
jgi:protein gp37